MTYKIHINGYFLGWHRGFVKLYEEALQTECGYTGTQPYWDWTKWYSNLTASPLFDGSEYSLSGDGAPSNITELIVGQGVTFPAGSGGGCVTSGPFVNYTVPYRFFQFPEALSGAPPVDAWNYTPHCLERDLNPTVAARYTNQTDVDILLASANISEFQGTMNGIPASYSLGVHGGGHATLGIQGFDFFASPGDPAFYLHHAQIDRMWTLWQAQNPRERQFAVYGTQTILDTPPSPNVTLADKISWSLVGEDKYLWELMDVHAESLCYRYE